jgi:hypothetical protein
VRRNQCKEINFETKDKQPQSKQNKLKEKRRGPRHQLKEIKTNKRSPGAIEEPFTKRHEVLRFFLPKKEQYIHSTLCDLCGDSAPFFLE